MIQNVSLNHTSTVKSSNSISFQGSRLNKVTTILETGKDSFVKSAKKARESLSNARKTMNRLHDKKDLPIRDNSFFGKIRTKMNNLHDMKDNEAPLSILKRQIKSLLKK